MRILTPLIAIVSVWGTASGESLLGFDLSDAIIPTHEIQRGGPPPDGIPAIDEPRFTPAGKVRFLEPEDIVIGFSDGDIHRAYPLRVLVWHEIVNDTVAGQPVAVVYCPLCGTATVFDRRIDGQTLRFGVSGLLYNSDVLMFDRATKSLWSQLAMKSVSGPYAGTPLRWLPSRQMTWSAWQEQHPDGEVLNTRTGFNRDYRRMPYQGYEKTPRTMFPYQKNRDDLETKTWVAAVRVGHAAKAYPINSLPVNQWIDDHVGLTPVRFRYHRPSSFFEIRTADGKPLPVVHAYWFAWQAFYPETEVYSQ